MRYCRFCEYLYQCPDAFKYDECPHVLDILFEEMGVGYEEIQTKVNRLHL